MAQDGSQAARRVTSLSSVLLIGQGLIQSQELLRVSPLKTEATLPADLLFDFSCQHSQLRAGSPDSHSFLISLPFFVASLRVHCHYLPSTRTFSVRLPARPRPPETETH